jgi:hypothetical protein
MDDQTSCGKYQSEEADPAANNGTTLLSANASKADPEMSLKPLPTDVVSRGYTDSPSRWLQAFENISLDHPKSGLEDDSQEDNQALYIGSGLDDDDHEFSGLFLRKWLSNTANQRPTATSVTLTILKNILVERGMAEFRAIPDTQWMAQPNDGSGSSGSASGPAPSSSPISASSGNSESSATGRKRSRDDGDGAPDGSEGPPDPPTPSPESSVDHAHKLKLACPFRKHDPERYNLHNYRGCALSNWETTARIKYEM